MQRDGERLAAFFEEHRRCDGLGLETGVEAAQVRVTCDGCGGAITVPLRPQSLLLGEESR